MRRSTQIDRPYTKSEATAISQADAWLTKHSIETDRVICVIRVPASRAGLVQAGQRIQFKAPHMPGYSAFTWMRVVMCTPKPANEAATHYDIALELTSGPPAAPTIPIYAQVMGSDHGCEADEDALPKTLRWDFDGDNPKSGWLPAPLTGPVAYYECPYYAGRWIGIEATADNTLDIHHGGEWAGVDGGEGEFTVELRQNGVAIASYTWVSDGGGLHYVGGTVELDATVDATAGDIFTVYVETNGHIAMFKYRSNPAAPQTHMQLVVSGTGSADTIIHLPPTSGSSVVGETPNPDPDGVFTEFVTLTPYRSGTLVVFVDGLAIPSSEVTETNPTEGRFTLSWAPDADELITCSYLTG